MNVTEVVKIARKDRSMVEGVHLNISRNKRPVQDREKDVATCK